MQNAPLSSRRRCRHAAALAVCACTAFLARANRAAPAPRIVCDEPVVRFGERFADDPPFRHDFTLRNEGDLSLEISEVENRCGCTDIVLSSRIIRPGESATLTAALSMRRRSGAVRETLTVISNDPRQLRLDLGFEGTVRPFVEVTPAAALLGRVPSDRETELRLRVMFPMERPDRLTWAEPSVPWLRVEMRTIEPDRVYEMIARTIPPLAAPHHHLQGVIRLKTASGRAGDIEIPVIGWIATPVTVMPDALPLPAAGARPLTRYIMIRAGSAQDLRIERVETPDAGIRATVMPLEDGQYHIRLEGIVPDRLAPDAAVRVRMRHDGGVEEYRIPFVREPAGAMRDSPRIFQGLLAVSYGQDSGALPPNSRDFSH